MPTEQPLFQVEPGMPKVEPVPPQKVSVVPQPVHQEPERTVKVEAKSAEPVQPPKESTPAPQSRPMVGSPVKPRVLSDNVVERMAYDPEVRNNKRKLFIGLGVVLFLIILTVLGNQFHWWTAIGNNVATLSQKILVKGKVESRAEVIAESAKKKSWREGRHNGCNARENQSPG